MRAIIFLLVLLSANNISSAQEILFAVGQATSIVEAIDSEDLEGLISAIHPERGVRFSPHGEMHNDEVVLHPEEVLEVYSGETEFLWGYTDGSAYEILLTFRDYFDKYLSGFSNTEMAVSNEIELRSNTTSNASEFFSNCLFVEFYKPPSGPVLQDWKSLWLVLEEDDDGRWYLVGLINDQWTT